MQENATQLKTVLQMLPIPAFFTDGEAVTWSNDACRRLPLREGELIAPLLGKNMALFREKGENATAYLAIGIGATTLEAAIRRIGDEDLFILSENAPPDTTPLRAVASGISPALQELMIAGGKLLPYLEEQEDETVQAWTAAVSHASFRLLRAVGSLQFFDRITAHPSASEFVQLDLTEELQKLCDRAADILRDGRIELVSELPDKPVLATGDRKALQYALLHLIANAAEHCGDDRVVRFSAQTAGRWLRIRVTGSGRVEQDALSTAFSRYLYPERGAKGVGLGLPIARAVAAQHGGSLLLESSEQGTSAVMAIDLTLPAPMMLRSARTEYSSGYDPALIVLSSVLPPETFDSRNIDL